MSLFIFFFFALHLAGCFAAFFAFPPPLLVDVLLLRLHPWPFNIFITLFADSATFLDTMSRIFTLGTVIRAMCLTLLRPDIRASELTAL